MDSVWNNIKAWICDFFGVGSLSEILNGALPKEYYYLMAAAGIFILVLIIALVVGVRRSRRKKKASRKVESVPQNPQADIIVRRKTTSILKKQSLEDVLHNPAYLPIDCSEFCDDSAVRRIYLKNTCVKEIYNMYAEDLRNSETPKEDGCMVLGRWVHDEQSDEYYVSLEEIVKPGDDAVSRNMS